MKRTHLVQLLFLLGCCGALPLPASQHDPLPTPSPVGSSNTTASGSRRAAPDFPQLHREQLHPSPEPDELSKGLVFMRREPVLLNVDSWSVVIQVNFSSYVTAIQQFQGWIIESDLSRELTLRNLTSPEDRHLQLGVIQQLLRFQTGSKRLVTEVLSLQDHMETVAYNHRYSPEQPPTKATRSKKGPVRQERQVVVAALMFLFGVFSTFHYAATNDKVNSIQMRSRAMGHLVTDQLSVLNHTYAQQNKLKKQLKKSMEGSVLLAGEVAALTRRWYQEEQNVATRFVFIGEVMRLTAVWEQQYEMLSNDVRQLKEAFYATSREELHPFFLPHETYLKLTRQIQNQLPHGKELMTHEVATGNLYPYFRLPKLTAFMYEGTLRIFLEFPLIHINKVFDVYEPLSLPSSIPSSDLFFSIVPEAELLAISKNNDYYFYLSKAEMAACDRTVVTVCHLPKALMRTSTPSCLLAMKNGDMQVAEQLCKVVTQKELTPIFYKPDNSLQYMYAVSKRIPISLRCERAIRPPFPSFLEGVGYLTIPPTCTAHTATFALYGAGILGLGELHMDEPIVLPHIEGLPSVLFLGSLNLTAEAAKYKKIHDLFSQT